jgi:hypothetical protein
MKGLARYILGSLALVLVGGACLAAGLLEREVVRAQQDLATLNYDAPESALGDPDADTERYFQYASRIPGIGRGPLQDLRARDAAWRYWQRQYGRLVPVEGDPLGRVAGENVALQLTVANAVYRSSAALAKDRQATLQALDAAVNAYLGVLKNSTRNEDAAFNFEYLVRVRDDIAKGRRKSAFPTSGPASADNTPHGEPGAPPQGTNTGDFKVHVPMESEEMQKKAGEQAGQGQERKRKG